MTPTTKENPMPQNDEAERLLNMLHESKAGRDVRNAVAALIRAQAARIAELEALVAAEFDMLDSTWKARAEAAEKALAEINGQLNAAK